MQNALEIETGFDLERFIPGTVQINHTDYIILTGYEGLGGCFWCGGELKGKLKRYCYGHMTLYYDNFMWGYASVEALRRADYKCENCGVYFPPGAWSELKRLEVHHIVPLKGERRDFSAFNLPWNLIVFCHDCHLLVHAIMRGQNASAAIDIFTLAGVRGQGVFEVFK